MNLVPPTVGFISPPRWFDPAPAEFLDIAPPGMRTQQTLFPVPDFDYSLAAIAEAGPVLTDCARYMVACGCTLVAQVGVPFAWAGTASEDEARCRGQELTASAAVPVVMNGLAIVDGLRAVGAHRISVCCTYYDEIWRDAFSGFLASAGFEVLHAGTFVDHGIFANQAAVDAHGWTFGPALARRSLREARRRAPAAAAIVMSGAGVRTLDLLADAEEEIGVPIVAADCALYWAVLGTLGLPGPRDRGRLFRTLKPWRLAEVTE